MIVTHLCHSPMLTVPPGERHDSGDRLCTWSYDANVRNYGSVICSESFRTKSDAAMSNEITDLIRPSLKQTHSSRALKRHVPYGRDFAGFLIRTTKRGHTYQQKRKAATTAWM